MLGSLLSFAPSMMSQAGPMSSMMADGAKRAKKEGIAKMLSGIGKQGQDEGGLPGLPSYQPQQFDVQSFLASLLGG